MYSLPIRVTFAAFTIASAASMEPMRPFVSTMPSASAAMSRRNVTELRSIIPASMTPLVRCTVCLVACAAAACGRTEEAAPPVATPSVTLERTTATIGSPLGMKYRFAVAGDAPAFADDYWVFVHFLDPDGELMWT